MNSHRQGLLLFFIMISPVFIIALIIFMLIANTPAEEKVRNKRFFAEQRQLAQEMWQKQKVQEERNRLAIDGLMNNPSASQKLVYDYQKYWLIKRDFRYFLVPIEYGVIHGFSFFWPTNLQHQYSTAIYHDRKDIEKREKARVIVHFRSRYDYNYNNVKLLPLDKTCSTKLYSAFWKGIIIGVEVDRQLYSKKWSAICHEVIRILNLVKEVKP